MRDTRAFFGRRRVFSRDQFAAFAGRQGSRSPRTADSLLAYHVRAGNLVRVRRGLYAAVPAGAQPSSFSVDPFFVAANLAPGAVVGFHAALQLHGQALAVHNRYVAYTPGPVRPLTHQLNEYLAVQHPKPLREAGMEAFGVMDVQRDGVAVSVTSVGRTVVDLLVRPRLVGTPREAWRSIFSLRSLNVRLAIDYSLLLRSATSAAKLGFYLDRQREVLEVEADQLEELRERAPRSPVYFDPDRRGPQTLASDWNLIVPAYTL